MSRPTASKLARKRQHATKRAAERAAKKARNVGWPINTTTIERVLL